MKTLAQWAILIGAGLFLASYVMKGLVPFKRLAEFGVIGGVALWLLAKFM